MRPYVGRMHFEDGRSSRGMIETLSFKWILTQRKHETQAKEVDGSPESSMSPRKSPLIIGLHYFGRAEVGQSRHLM